MYKISVIIPVFNSELYLEKCLNSVLNQTLKEIEVIIINDGSSDNSLNIINKYEKNFNNIKVISKKNEGQAIARNMGIDLASGEFITFVDSDDYIQLDMLEKLYKNAIEQQSDISICDYYEEINERKILKKSLYMESDSIIKSYILSVAGPCSKIIKTNIFKENNLRFLENNIYEDLAIIPSLALYVKKISYVYEPLYNYVLRINSTMQQTKYNKKMESIFNVMDCLYNQFSNTIYKEELEFLFINHLLYASFGRFLKYPNNKKNLIKIINYIQLYFPNWKNNKYLKNKTFIYKKTCNVFIRNNQFELFLYKLFRKIVRSVYEN